MSTEAPARDSFRPSEVTAGPEVVADFLRDLRYDVEGGADPLAAVERAITALPVRLRNAVEAVIARLRGQHSVDEWGFDEQFAEAAFGLVELGYDLWWRGDVEGVGNVPGHGGALLVANRLALPSPIVAGLVTTAIMKCHPLPRWPRFMVGQQLLGVPLVSGIARRCGAVPAGAEDAVALLERGELVCCFDQPGFAELGRQTGAPIVPVAIVGTPRRVEFRSPIVRSNPESGYDRLDGDSHGNRG